MLYTENDLKTKFVPAKDTHRAIRENKLKFRFGEFSQREASVVRECIEKFLKDNNLTMKDLQGYLHAGKEFPMHELNLLCTSLLDFRTYKSVFAHISFTYHPFIYAKFTQEDDLNLLDLVEQRGYLWKAISSDIDKYRDVCRSRFMKLKGIHKKSLYKKDIIQIVKDGIPTTEKEWMDVCERLQVSQALLSHRINEYIKGEIFESDNSIYGDIILCAGILSYNHFCALPINIEVFKAFIDNETENYARNAATISREEKRRENENQIKNDNENIEDYENQNINDNENQIKNDNENESNAQNEEERNIKSVDKISSIPDKLDDENTVKPVINSQDKLLDRNREHFADFKSKIRSLLCITPEFDLNVEVEDQDVFWNTISKYTEIAAITLKSRFKVLKASHRIKTFGNLVDLLESLGYDYLICKIKSALLKDLN